MKLRIACVQFCPTLGKIEANIAKVNNLLAGVKKDIDLLVLPELSLTGYNFPSAKEIQPYLEIARAGPTFNLASELSARFGCTTIIGYPERFQNTTYNSAMVVDENGNLVYNYRKTHLYETDETWGCSENPDKSFAPVMLKLGTEKKSIATNIGICMDLNPYKFEAPFNEFEFSLLCWRNGSQLVVVPTAWLSADSPSINDDLTKKEKKEMSQAWKEILETPTEDLAIPLELLVNYWIKRFFPFVRHPMNQLPRLPGKTTVVLCNRTGIEDDVMYGGSSSIIQFDSEKPDDLNVDQTNPSVNVLSSAGWASEEVIYHEVEI